MSVPHHHGFPDGVVGATFVVDGGALAAGIAPPEAAEKPAARGPDRTVLLLPGYTGSKEDFGPLLPMLADAGMTAVAIDLRGQFESTGPDDEVAYRRDQLAADVGAVIEQLHGPHVVAHSYGGIVARAAVLAGARPLTLTLLDSGPSGIQGGRRQLIDAMEPILADGGLDAVWAAAELLNANDPRRAGVPESVQAFLRKRFLAASPIGLKVMGEDLRSEPDRVDELGAVGLPILVAHGEADDAWPPAVQREMATRLGAAYAVIPQAMHSPAVESPEATAAALLGFWRARQATGV